MKIVKLIKPYKHYSEGKILNFDDNTAKRLLEQGIAREANTRDYLVQPQFGLGARTRALKNPNY